MVSNFCPSVLALRLNDSEKQFGRELPSNSDWLCWFVERCFVLFSVVVVWWGRSWCGSVYFPCGISPFILGQFWSLGIKVSNLRDSIFPMGWWVTLPGDSSGTVSLPNKLAIWNVLAFHRKVTWLSN